MFGCLGDLGIVERTLPHRVFGTRAIFILLLTLHKLLIMQLFFNSLLFLLSPACTIFCAQVNDPGRAVLSPRLDGGLRQHFINPRQGLQHHSAGLHWPCYVTTSECRALRSATSGPAWEMEPCPASSSDRVINGEDINQLTRFYAQSFKFLTCVRFDHVNKHCLLKTLPLPMLIGDS